MRSVSRLVRYSLLLGCCILCGALAFFSVAAPSVLIKIPTRDNPTSFFETLDAYQRNLSVHNNCRFLITCDNDDATMNNAGVIKKLAGYANVRYEFVAQKTAVESFNAGLASEKFDILIVSSDEKAPMVKEFEKNIVDRYQKLFPALDGVVVFRAGARTSELDGIFVIGRAFYDRFGFVFNPAYKEFCASQELISVAKMLKKFEVASENMFFRKQVAAKNRSPQIEQHDQETFIARRNQRFDLTEDELRKAVSKDWSILICTMYERQAAFKRLYDKLQNQINRLGLQDRIEILSYLDNRGEHSTGEKRNWLLSHSDGYYINYIDDDDDVSDDYIKVIHDAIVQHPDSVGLRGLIALSKRDIRVFIHSIKYNSFFERDHVYYRPPNHLNTIKRYIGVQFSFPDIYNGEDTNWAMQIANTGLIKTEVDIQTPYYYYLPSYCLDKTDFSVFEGRKNIRVAA